MGTDFKWLWGFFFGGFSSPPPPPRGRRGRGCVVADVNSWTVDYLAYSPERLWAGIQTAVLDWVIKFSVHHFLQIAFEVQQIDNYWGSKTSSTAAST